MRQTSRLRITAFILAISLALSGCGVLSGNNDDLLSLPKTASTISQLQEEIDKLINAGHEYSAPTSGDKRQAVQLEDLDGDGEEEALIFLRTTHELPLKIALFKKADDMYRLAAEVELWGSSFDSVGYYDINGDGSKNIFVGCSLGTGVPKALNIFDVSDGEFDMFLSCAYNGYTVFDINSDKEAEVVVVRHDTEVGGLAEVYSYVDESRDLQLVTITRLSQYTDSLKRLRVGYLHGGEPAIFISSIYNKTDLVTDVCAFKRGSFVNILMDEQTGMSRHFVRQYTMHGGDINGDGKYDLPQLVAVPEYEGKRSTEQLRKVVWYNYDIYGNSHEVIQTYHNNADGWYFIIPDIWKESMTVDRRDSVSGERAIVFSIMVDGVIPMDILTIYMLTGDNREDRSALEGRFTLMRTSTRIYAAKLSNLPGEFSIYGVSEQQVRDMFQQIKNEWYTGELTP